MENINSRVVAGGQEWAEARNIHEFVEAVINWLAIRFMVALKDKKGILLLRILHECVYFSTAKDLEPMQVCWRSL